LTHEEIHYLQGVANRLELISGNINTSDSRLKLGRIHLVPLDLIQDGEFSAKQSADAEEGANIPAVARTNSSNWPMITKYLETTQSHSWPKISEYLNARPK
jgi:hypothetical protein